MAGKSKYGNMGENAIAANQNWTDVIEKERTTATQWAQDWGFLIRRKPGEEEIKGRSAKDIEKMINSMQAEADEMTKKIDDRYAKTGGSWQQASNTIGSADWNEDTVISNAIWKSNSLTNDRWIQPTNPYN